jgi:hypothetical protein
MNINSSCARRIEMRANEAFPSTYLKSADVKDRPIVATISHIEQVNVGQGKDAKDKLALFFENGKPMVLNRTNWETLEDAFGDSDNWAGHKVKIKAVRTSYQGKPVDGIRLDPIVSKPAAKNDELNEDDMPPI